MIRLHVFLLLIVSLSAVWALPGRGEHGEAVVPAVQNLIKNHCLDCHHRDEATSELDLESIADVAFVDNAAVWEKVVKRLRAGQMPPSEADRPDEELVAEALTGLEERLDHHAQMHPNPGRTDTFRRLTRFEYGNAIRDLLSLEIDPVKLLPADEASHGFDNITVGELSPALLNRYVSAAQKISRLALGRSTLTPDGRTIRIRPDVTQEERVDGLTPGTRGGMLIKHHFPQDAEYEFTIRLTRDRNEQVEGLSKPHELELLIDFERGKLFTVQPPRGKGSSVDDYSRPSHQNVDRHLKVRLPVKAGSHQIGVTFIKNPSSLLETKRQPLNVHYNMYRHPRLGPAVYQLSITGPFEKTSPGDTPSRNRVLSRRPQGPEDEEECAEQILVNLMRKAYRRPIDEADLRKPMELYRQASQQGGFEAGIELALSYLLISPEFLFRVERDPPQASPGSPYKISDLELASRLSFFLWSSLPDEELLTLAEQGVLSEPDRLREQTARMLQDDRARSLVTSFAGQWLYLRNLDSVTPNARLFPDFDDNLRQAFRRETELFFESIIRDDRSVLELLRADYTFLNERLAKHYGIPHVYGSRFRRVNLGSDSNRGGLLRQGSILSVTSYATRTSPVIRGKWILENILGTPPPPPPPNVPVLSETTVSAKLPLRERLAQHRQDAACASCHRLIDPVGFALENFDAVGQWRDSLDGAAIDVSGGLPDGRVLQGVGGLEDGLLDRPELFVGTLAEKLLTYAIGRGIEHYDAPAIRKIVRQAGDHDYCFSELIQGIVSSPPFQMRMSQ